MLLHEMQHYHSCTLACDLVVRAFAM